MESTALEAVRAVIGADVGAMDALSEWSAVFAALPDPRGANATTCGASWGARPPPCCATVARSTRWGKGVRGAGTC